MTIIHDMYKDNRNIVRTNNAESSEFETKVRFKQG